MSKTGDWKMRSKFAGTLIFTLLAGSAFAKDPAPAPGNKPPRFAQLPPPKTVNECLEQWRSRIADPRPNGKYGLPPDQMCQNSMQITADQGRCKKIYEAVIEAYNNAAGSVKMVCELVPQAAAAKCDGQGNCVGGTAEFRKKYAENLEIHYGYVDELVKKMDEMGKLGLEVSEQYAADLREFKAAPDPTQPSDKARGHGGATAAEALRNHAGQDAESILNLIQKARQYSTITQNEVDRMKSPYVFEQLQASATAFDQKRDLQEYAESLRNQQREAASQAVRLEQQSSNMNSLTQASTLPALGALGALPSPGSVTGSAENSAAYPVAQLSGSTPPPLTEVDASNQAGTPRARSVRAPIAAASAANQLAGATKVGGVVVAEGALASAPGAAAALNSTTASMPGGSSLREELRNKLARNSRSFRGMGGAEGATLSTGKEGRSAAARAEAANEVLAETGSQFESAPIEAAMMKNSETEGAVKDMVNSFQNSLGDRSPASNDTESGNEILTSESPSLFLRLKEVHVRCVKRGCVGRVTKGAI